MSFVRPRLAVDSCDHQILSPNILQHHLIFSMNVPNISAHLASVAEKGVKLFNQTQEMNQVLGTKDPLDSDVDTTEQQQYVKSYEADKENTLGEQYQSQALSVLSAFARGLPPTFAPYPLSGGKIYSDLTSSEGNSEEDLTQEKAVEIFLSTLKTATLDLNPTPSQIDCLEVVELAQKNHFCDPDKHIDPRDLISIPMRQFPKIKLALPEDSPAVIYEASLDPNSPDFIEEVIAENENFLYKVFRDKLTSGHIFAAKVGAFLMQEVLDRKNSTGMKHFKAETRVELVSGHSKDPSALTFVRDAARKEGYQTRRTYQHASNWSRDSIDSGERDHSPIPPQFNLDDKEIHRWLTRI
ncbi:hypothetical protein ElyMa_000767900 [Elysia marginata]|uniref:Uncharacterized protein n=1 Tax=Elysia marginata TaxID=1093978 RepID=A0AAV4GTU7_9GAST|nr:hypothetical protein ElyMa_000767900 [Elysia marginata]